MRTSPQRRRYSNDNGTQNQQYHQSSSEDANHSRIMNSSLLTMEDEDEEHQQQQLSKGRGQQNQMVDSIVNAAQICNSLVSEYCGLCTFYIDKQVQYELISTAATATGTSSVLPSSTFDLQHGANSEYYLGVGGRNKAARDIRQATMMLFDEESVVESVSSR